jgi:hypothetical protein
VCPRRFEPQPFPVIVRVHAQEFDTATVHRLQEWYLTIGDYDAA